MGWKRKLKESYRQEVVAPKDNGALSKHLGIATSEKPKRYVNPTKIGARVAIAVCLLVVIGGPISVYLLSHTSVKTHGQLKQKNYRSAETSSLRASTVKALNTISYNDGPFSLHEVDDEFKGNVNSFAFNLHKQFNEKQTYLYSPYCAYLNLDLLSLASQGAVENNANTYLGELANRQANVPNSILTNFYTGEDGSAHVYQGAFLQEGLELKEGYVDKLTSRRAEVYSLDMDKDLASIPDWANKRINANMLDEKMLEYKAGESIAYYLSILDFDGKWASSYSDSKTTKMDFTSLDGKTNKLDFMSHDISFVHKDSKNANGRKDVGIYDYGDYISAYDYYKNGYSIQYLTPKERGKDIFALLNNVNFFVEDETKFFDGSSIFDPENKLSSDWDRYFWTVTFIMPKFTFASLTDLTPKIKGMGLNGFYDDLQNSLSGGITLSPNGGAIAFTKQANSIEFTENGTVAKSLTFSMGYGASAPMIRAQNYIITLDEAFVYVIRDPNGLPLFVGAFNN